MKNWIFPSGWCTKIHIFRTYIHIRFKLKLKNLWVIVPLEKKLILVKAHCVRPMLSFPSSPLWIGLPNLLALKLEKKWFFSVMESKRVKYFSLKGNSKGPYSGIMVQVLRKCPALGRVRTQTPSTVQMYPWQTKT